MQCMLCRLTRALSPDTVSSRYGAVHGPRPGCCCCGSCITGPVTVSVSAQVSRFLSKTSSTLSTPWIGAGVAAVELWRIAYPRAVETISAVAHPQRSQVITATK